MIVRVSDRITKRRTIITSSYMITIAYAIWYVSVVCIIFDCFMPILYNFHIFLATFYMIYWTNLLIQCAVPVLVCCTFFVSQKIHIERSPNVIKLYEELFWNIYDFWEVEWTQTGAHSDHNPPGHAGRAQLSCALLEGRLGALILAQER